MNKKHLFQKTIEYGLLATFFVFTFFINIALFSPDDNIHPLIAVNFSIADFFIGFILILWIIKIIIYKEWKQIKLPPIPVLLFIGAGALSFVNSLLLSQWLKEIIQLIEYFFLFYILLINNLQLIKTATIKNVLFIFTSITLIIAFIQHTIINSDTYLVRGTFENRNTFGMFLCFSLPLVYSELLASASIMKKIWMSTLLLLSCWVLLSGSAILAIFISMLIISWIYSRKAFLKFLLVIIGISAAYLVVFPKKNMTAIKDFASIYEEGNINKSYYRILNIVSYFNKTQVMSKDIGENDLQVLCDNYFRVKLSESLKGNRYDDMDNEKHIKNRYLAMAAALNMFYEYPVTGCGLGNYQQNVGKYFLEFPKINTAEPFQNNTYLIIVSTTGLVGLTAIFYLLLSMVKKSHQKYIVSTYPRKLFYLGLFGSIIALMINSFFTYLFTASLLVPFILILYLSENEVSDNT